MRRTDPCGEWSVMVAVHEQQYRLNSSTSTATFQVQRTSSIGSNLHLEPLYHESLSSWYVFSLSFLPPYLTYPTSLHFTSLHSTSVYPLYFTSACLLLFTSLQPTYLTSTTSTSLRSCTPFLHRCLLCVFSPRSAPGPLTTYSPTFHRRRNKDG